MIDTHIQLPDAEESLNFLHEALDFSGVSNVVVVQKEPCKKANQASLELAKNSEDLVAGVVTWAPLTDERTLKIQLDEDRRKMHVCGYVADIHREDTVQWRDNEDIHHGVGLIAHSGKPLDLLIKPSQLRNIISFIDAHPDLPIILDHCFGEAAEDTPAWRRLLKEVGRRPHVSYRLSGLAPVASAETACEATESVLAAFNAALDGFGCERLLYASGWPVTPARYPIWLNTIDNLIHELSPEEQSAIYGDNAETIYSLELSN